MNWMDAVLSAKKDGAVYPGDQQQKGTTMSKYIDLAQKIALDWGYMSNEASRALSWLDEHPDQVPGRTMTRSEYQDILNDAVKVSGYGNDWERGFGTGLVVSGTKVVPDPEPTSAEQMEADLKAWGIPSGQALSLGPWLAGQGWAKFPEDDDDH